MDLSSYPKALIYGWIREIRRSSERLGHIRRAEKCFDKTLAVELIEFIKILKEPKSVRMAILELKNLDKNLAEGLVVYLLQRAIQNRRSDARMVEALIIAGLCTGSRQAWMLAFTVLKSHSALAKRVFLFAGNDADSSGKNICEGLVEDELGDFYLLLCRLFPLAEDPEEKSGCLPPRRGLVRFRNGVLEALGSRNTLAACAQLKRLATAFPDQATWMLYRYQQTLSAVRRNEWQAFPLSDLAAVLTGDNKRIVRDNGDLMNLVLESLGALQQHLTESTLPAVEDLWQWEDAGLRRKNFRHKDEEAVSDYIARWLRDRIGAESGVVVNREVQPRRGKRTDILVEAWSHSVDGRNRQETPLSVTIEVKGCWNGQIKTSAKDQLLDDYLRPFRRTHGIFTVVSNFQADG